MSGAAEYDGEPDALLRGVGAPGELRPSGLRAPDQAADLPWARRGDDLDAPLWLSVDAVPAQLTQIRQQLRAFCERRGVPEEHLQRALIAASEACANVVQHAYEDRGPVEVHAWIDRALRIVVRDQGRGFDGADVLPGTFGLLLLHAVCDDLTIARNGVTPGTSLFMRFRLPL